MDFVAKSPPDGYTLGGGYASAHMSFNAGLYKSLPYDPVNDFVPITRIVSGGFNTFLVNPDLPANQSDRGVHQRSPRPAQEGKLLTFRLRWRGAQSRILRSSCSKQAAGIEMVHVPVQGIGAGRDGCRSAGDVDHDRCRSAAGDPACRGREAQGHRRSIHLTYARSVCRTCRRWRGRHQERRTCGVDRHVRTGQDAPGGDVEVARLRC